MNTNTEDTLRQRAEEILKSKIGSSAWANYFQTHEQETLISAMLDFHKEASTTGLRWVKASERLPYERAGHYAARVKSNLSHGYDYYEMYHEIEGDANNVTINGKNWLEGDELTGLEWLEETPSKEQQKQAITDIMEADQKDGLYEGDDFVYKPIRVSDRSEPMPKDGNCYLLFDNGEIRHFFQDDLPFASVTHWLKKVPSTPNK